MFSTRMERRSAGVAAAAALALILAGCGDEEADPENDPPAATQPTDAPPADGGPTDETPTDPPTDDEPTDMPPADDEPTETGPGATVDPTEDVSDDSGPPVDDGTLPTGPPSDAVLQDPETDAAIQDLADREGVDPDDITISGHQGVTWRDGSLGCPEPGQAYTQALVPGEQLILELAGDLFNYHRAEGQPYRFCSGPRGMTDDGPSTS